jgi:hypothetical protein
MPVLASHRRSKATRRAARGAIVVAGLIGTARVHADQYEAALSVRPAGAVGRVAEPVGAVAASGDRAAAPVVASVYGGGLDVGLSYGLRDWLDVGAELDVVGFTQATYASANVTISGNPFMGRVERTTRAAQLHLGATLRLGVAWVPTCYLGVGLGARQRTAGTLGFDDQGARVLLTPDDMGAGMSLDVVTAARVGLEHRLDRRWTVGVDAGIRHAIGIGASSLDILAVNLSLAYTWYPTLAP